MGRRNLLSQVAEEKVPGVEGLLDAQRAEALRAAVRTESPPKDAGMEQSRVDAVRKAECRPRDAS